MELLSKYCSASNIVDYILNDKRYKELNPDQKENLIIQVFHSTNWNQLKKEDHIILLQEFENIIALKWKRTPYRFVELKSDYKWDNLLMDIGIHPSTKQFFIRKNFIEDGIKQYVENSKVEEMQIEHLNIELLDGLTHEQYHIITRERKNHNYPILYREHKEDEIWYKVSDLSDRKLEKGDKRYYRYRMVPDEYYAFKYSENRVKCIFSTLNQYYGEDENYSKYLEYVFKNESRVINTYKEDFPSCGSLTYDEIYQRILEGYLKDFSLKENVSIEELKRELSLMPSIFDRCE